MRPFHPAAARCRLSSSQVAVFFLSSHGCADCCLASRGPPALDALIAPTDPCCRQWPRPASSQYVNSTTEYDFEVFRDVSHAVSRMAVGWRSWNAFYADIDDAKIRAQIDALVKPRDAANTSLYSLGFRSVGIDEGWEGCGLGINGTVHYNNGTPTVDPKRFPKMSALVAYGHKHGVEMGFYLNGCGCNEKRVRSASSSPLIS